MIERPRFRSHFRVDIVEPDLVFLSAENRHFLLRGKLYSMLAPLLDGRRTPDEIAALLDKQVTRSQVYYGLLRMEHQGCLAEGTSTLPAAESAYWESQDLNSSSNASVTVFTFGESPAALLKNKLDHVGIQQNDNADLWVALTDDYLRPELSDLNRKALALGKPWMLVKPAGVSPWIGPLFVPGRTGCWECLAHRVRLNRPVDAFVATVSPVLKPEASLPSTIEIALNMAATEIARYFAGAKKHNLEGQILTLDTTTWQTERHHLVRRPQCAACGVALHPNRASEPIVLASCTKTFVIDGGHRSVRPHQTVERYSHHVSPITGVVGKLDLEGRNEQLHAFCAHVRTAVRTGDYDSLQYTVTNLAGGKGASATQARASVLCEALERYSGYVSGDEICRHAIYRELGDAAIHPNACMLLSDEQYRNHEELNRLDLSFNRSALPFDKDRPFDWTPLWSLTRKETRYLPTRYCYMQHPLTDECKYLLADTNGMAAGNTMEEAILQGFLELVERDSVAIWWYNRLRRPAIDLESVDEPYIHEMRDWYRRANRDLWVLDLTSDMEIPVFAAISRRNNSAEQGLIYAFGAHLDPRIAVLRAVTELNQSAAMEGGVHKQNSFPTAEARFIERWLKTATLESEFYLAPDAAVRSRLLSDYPRNFSDDLREDVLRCQSLVERAGLEMLVLDQTRPDVGLKVVRVVVPGLRHFWARFAPGRLYDVPVHMGWLQMQKSERELNPVPVFI